MIICDIDWTIADCNHRKKFLKKDIIDINKCKKCKYIKEKRIVISSISL